ncbi:xanthine dehydrogenase small subunit [Aromatoleum petrolei]|uniref:Xanthine dehydrogenase small subunit n=1 Tax=Aromatoleum petrolei TaxID=76116 RepID=A0ABX1MXC8_9RHOO|nr:xanthine dehydrogenase small subunit [Aromatoleum petrolei]NMF90956.1 xanthine dehydrogenase small subunit [Aromatoleum petrolei]QTQ35430.1 Xanthine dehydrogenase, small subunit [Aromatoleum petrolei]
MNTQAIRFLLNGEPVEVTGVAPTTSLLNWLRVHQRLTGTKEGCAEGDCGACTVVVGELEGEDDALRLQTVNACIQFVPALDGKAVFTVEYLRRQTGGGLHPVQQAMVDCHGSQCGFCTPGFVMSLWELYNDCSASGDRPDDNRIRSALAGNLCRCTGYRPILEAGARMFDLPAVGLDGPTLRAQLLALRRRDGLAYAHGENSFHAPRTLADLAALRSRHPEATILAGCTDIGLWVNKQFRELGALIYIGQVAELRQIGEAGGALRIGAGVSLSDAYAALCRHYPELGELWDRFASPPVRNAGTLGGNIANGSPIGDSMPVLIALGSRIVLHSVRGRRTLPLQDFYLDYMKRDLAADEIVEAVEVPLPVPGLQVRSWKVSKRYDSDISAVCGAFALRIEDGRVREPRIAFGGMAATPKRAARTEAALDGRPWDEETLAHALLALELDYAPLTDMRASAGYRRRAAGGLLRRFFLETRPEVSLAAAQTRVFAAFDACTVTP